MKRLGHVLVLLALFCSPLLAERVVKVEALSTDTTTFRQNKIQLGMVELAAQLAPYQSSVDTSLFVLLAGDADGQTIQGRSGADKARVDIGETDPDQVTLIGPGATSGRVYAYSGGVYAVSPDGGTSFDIYDQGFGFNTDGAAGLYGGTSTGVGSTEGVLNLAGSRINVHSQQSPPTNANDSCTAGDTIDTATFHYYCEATDTWVRVAMATWP